MRWKQYVPYLKKIAIMLKRFFTTPGPALSFFLIIAFLLVALYPNQLTTQDPYEENFLVISTLLLHRETLWDQQTIIQDKELSELSYHPDGTLACVGPSGLYLELVDDSWQETKLGEENLYSLDFFNNTGFAAGQDGVIYRYVEDHWVREDSPANNHIFCIRIFAEDRALAVGAEGTVLYYDGNTWEQLESPTEKNLHHLSFINRNQAIIVGDSGTILNLEGDSLQKTIVDPPASLYSISTFNDQRAIAVGARGVIFSYEEENWKYTTSPEINNFLSSCIISEEEAFIGGEEGVLLRFDGEYWRRVPLDYRGPIITLTTWNSELYGLAGSYLDEFRSPCPTYPLGTDNLSRDLFSQMVYGTRGSIFTALNMALLIIILLTLLAYLLRNIPVKFKFHPFFQLIPPLIFSIILYPITGWDKLLILIAAGLLAVRTVLPPLIQTFQSLYNSPYYKACSVRGTPLQIFFQIFLPSLFPIILKYFLRIMAWSLFIETSLSFLGIAGGDFISWGTILNDAFWSNIWHLAWWWYIPPGLAVTITMFSLSTLDQYLPSEGDEINVPGN